MGSCDSGDATGSGSRAPGAPPPTLGSSPGWSRLLKPRPMASAAAAGTRGLVERPIDVQTPADAQGQFAEEGGLDISHGAQHILSNAACCSLLTQHVASSRLVFAKEQVVPYTRGLARTVLQRGASRRGVSMKWMELIRVRSNPVSLERALPHVQQHLTRSSGPARRDLLSSPRPVRRESGRRCGVAERRDASQDPGGPDACPRPGAPGLRGPRSGSRPP